MARPRIARYLERLMGRRPKSDLPKELINLIDQVGENVRTLRLARGMTQAELARRSKVSVTTLNEIETKRFRDIRLSTLLSIATVLSVPVVRLLQGSDVKLDLKDRAKLLKASEDIVRIARRITDRD